MNPEQFTELKDLLKNTVKETVNGKIDAIANEQRRVAEDLKDYVEKDTIWKDGDKQWKDNAMPLLEMIKKWQGFTSVGGFILKSVLLIGAVGTTIWGLIVWLRK